LFELAARQAGLVSSAQFAEFGLTRAVMRRVIRTGTLTPVVRGVLELGHALPPPTARTEELDRQRRRAALLGLLAYGPSAVSTGLCALVLLKVQGTPADLKPEVTLRRGDPRRPIPGIRVRRVPVRQWMSVDGFAVSVPEEALAQAVPGVDRLTAVSMMDSALHLRRVSVQGLARAHDLARGHRLVARTHGWWAQADGRAESPAETIARLTCADSGYPPDRLQLVLVDESGRFLAAVDLAWQLPDGRWLLVEVDGIDFHGSKAAVVADFHRQNRVVSPGTLLRRYTGADAASGRLAAEVGLILRCSGWQPGRASTSVPIRIGLAV
jgi:hypothetical protein